MAIGQWALWNPIRSTAMLKDAPVTGSISLTQTIRRALRRGGPSMSINKPPIRSSMEGNPIYTIGYGSRSFDVLCALLFRYGIGVVVDVRSEPWSKHHPEYRKRELATALSVAGIGFSHMGRELGGRPRDPSLLRDGRPDWELVRRSAPFRLSINRLCAAAREGPIMALLCAELDPERCHRSGVLSDALTKGGLEVIHILPGDETMAHRDLRRRRGGQQLELWMG